ncbi:hypothetical protein BLNAU_23938 [Blattamonas nauphoetae]|uniref:Uncharacterized protein n=1 Tax=Blattamonas nauphoetae TaxID=2049346 RepID=A0ABQ9WNU4_9EUKA|nr:hypothetical protein BLNAU_23938 [Blattamonas nauphoetae]
MLNLHSSSIPRTTLALCPTIIRREIGQATLTNDSPLGISERDLQTDKVEAIASVDGEDTGFWRRTCRPKPTVLHEGKYFQIPFQRTSQFFPTQIYCESDQETIVKLPASISDGDNPQNSIMFTIKGKGCTFEDDHGRLSSHSFVGNQASGLSSKFFPYLHDLYTGNLTKNGFKPDSTNFKHYILNFTGANLYPCSLDDFRVEFSPLIAGNSTAEYKHWKKAKFVWGYGTVENSGPYFSAHSQSGANYMISVAIPRKSIKVNTHYSLRLSKGDYKEIIPCSGLYRTE